MIGSIDCMKLDFDSLYYSIKIFLIVMVPSLIVGILAFSPFIKLSRFLFQNTPREFAPAGHQEKGKTPTMGGFLIIVCAVFGLMVSSLLSISVGYAIAASLVLFGAVGLWDDLCKVWYKRGITPRYKTMGMIFAAMIISGLWLQYLPEHWSGLGSHYGLVGYALLFAWSMLVIIGTSNAVNITDGLDGLAATSLFINMIFYGFTALFIATPESIVIGAICAMLAGFILAFWFYNRYPASIFMGDVGSLSLGHVWRPLHCF